MGIARLKIARTGDLSVS